jgi:protoporphyrinogen IX oxidase
MAHYYLWFKAFHVAAVICWMAALFYLPRLYVYHVKAARGSELDKTLQVMEYRLLKIIMNPAMIASYVFGFLNAYIYGFQALGIWFHVKIAAVLALTILHGFLARTRKNFVNGTNTHSEKFYRALNELPPLLMLVAVIMVIIKPFE